MDFELATQLALAADFDLARQWPGIVAMGVVVGFIAGMFGVGGGFLLTPLLSVVLGVPLPIAVGSGMCQMVGSSTVSYLRHRNLGNGEPRIAILLAPGSILGVAAGAQVVTKLSELGDATIAGSRVSLMATVLYAAFIVFLLSVARILWREGSSDIEVLSYVRRGPLAKLHVPPLIDLPSLPLRGVSAPLVAYIGLFMGFMSGLLGIGGGLIVIPILLYWVGFPFRHAAGTGAALTLLSAAIGTVAHALQGHVHLGLAMILLMGSGISAQFGAFATRRFSARVLRKGLAVTVLVTVALIAAELVRTFRAG